MGWTAAQREKHSETMKANHAERKRKRRIDALPAEMIGRDSDEPIELPKNWGELTPLTDEPEDISRQAPVQRSICQQDADQLTAMACIDAKIETYRNAIAVLESAKEMLLA